MLVGAKNGGRADRASGGINPSGPGGRRRGAKRPESEGTGTFGPGPPNAAAPAYRPTGRAARGRRRFAGLGPCGPQTRKTNAGAGAKGPRPCVVRAVRARRPPPPLRFPPPPKRQQNPRPFNQPDHAPSTTRKKVIAPASRSEGVYNRAGEPSEPFSGGMGQGLYVLDLRPCCPQARRRRERVAGAYADRRQQCLGAAGP